MIAGSTQDARPGVSTPLAPSLAAVLARTVSTYGVERGGGGKGGLNRMVLDLVTPEQVASLREKLADASRAANRPPPILAAWLPAAVDPEPGAEDQILASLSATWRCSGTGTCLSPPASEKRWSERGRWWSVRPT